jgi:hypothetical protein
MRKWCGILLYFSSILSTMVSNLGSTFSSSSVALEALVLKLAYSSNALAERKEPPFQHNDQK